MTRILARGLILFVLIATSNVGVSAPAQIPSSATRDTLRQVLAAEGIPLESAGDIHRTTRHIIIDTHVNPSAGQIVVLSRNWKPVATLPGWVLRILPSGAILYHRSSVHFAPTHSAELWVWDPVTKRDARLHPNEPWDSVRRAYVDTVRSIYRRAGEDWFRANNHHMDADQFDTRLGDTVVVASSGRTLAFLLSFGGGEGTPAATPPLDVAVVCRDVGTRRSRCREKPLATLARNHPGWLPIQILNDLIAGLP